MPVTTMFSKASTSMSLKHRAVWYRLNELDGEKKCFFFFQNTGGEKKVF